MGNGDVATVTTFSKFHVLCLTDAFLGTEFANLHDQDSNPGRLLDQKTSLKLSSEHELVFLKVPGPGANPGSFWFSFIFSL